MDNAKIYFQKYKKLQKKLNSMPSNVDNVPTTTTSSSPKKQTNDDNDEISTSLDRLKVQCNIARSNALEFKKNGDIESAKNELKKYKLLKVQIENIQLDHGSTGGGQNGNKMKKLLLERTKKLNKYDTIITNELLHIQRLMKLGQASRDALLIKKLKTAIDRCKKQKNTLLQYKTNTSIEIPHGTIHTIIDRLAIINHDIPQHTFMLTIHSLKNGCYKNSNDRQVNLYCKYNFGYPRKEPNEGVTKMLSSNINDTNWNENFFIPLGSGKLTSKATL